MGQLKKVLEEQKKSIKYPHFILDTELFHIELKEIESEYDEDIGIDMNIVSKIRLIDLPYRLGSGLLYEEASWKIASHNFLNLGLNSKFFNIWGIADEEPLERHILRYYSHFSTAMSLDNVYGLKKCLLGFEKSLGLNNGAN